MKLILASASPRRRELLAQMGLEFEIRVADCDEDTDISSPDLLVHELALRKARAAARAILTERAAKASDLQNPGEAFAVIGSDTVVAQGGVILGKPRDREDAIETLLSLSAKAHSVFTGLAVVYYKDGELHEVCEVCQTQVIFTKLTRSEAEAYADTGEPLDKAGSYGIQGRGGIFVERIDGDYYNVVGLPICRLNRILKQIGFCR